MEQNSKIHQACQCTQKTIIAGYPFDSVIDALIIWMQLKYRLDIKVFVWLLANVTEK